MIIEPFEFAQNLYRGPEPRTDDDFDMLTWHGVKTVVDLEMHLSPWAAWKLDDALTGRGMAYVPMPLIPILAPTQAQLLEAARLLVHLETDQVTAYVHCKEGVDRTGMVVAAFKLFAWHESLSDVMTEMYAHGFHRYRYMHWLPALREFAATYGMQG